MRTVCVVLENKEVIGVFANKEIAEYYMKQYIKETNQSIENIEYIESLLNDRYRDWETDRKSTRLNSSHSAKSRMPSSA